MCLGLFVGVAAVWAVSIYGVLGAILFQGRGRPTLRAMATQVSASPWGSHHLASCLSERRAPASAEVVCAVLLSTGRGKASSHMVFLILTAVRTCFVIAGEGVVHSDSAVRCDAGWHRMGSRAGLDQGLLQVCRCQYVPFELVHVCTFHGTSGPCGGSDCSGQCADTGWRSHRPEACECNVATHPAAGWLTWAWGGTSCTLRSS